MFQSQLLNEKFIPKKVQILTSKTLNEENISYSGCTNPCEINYIQSQVAQTEKCANDFRRNIRNPLLEYYEKHPELMRNNGTINLKLKENYRDYNNVVEWLDFQ